jgi:hypothetical protein
MADRQPFVQAELDILIYWIRARERVRAAKESGQPKPWTDDPLLRDFRWCNVRRLDDRVSRWLFERWYGDPDGDPVAAAALARLVNWPDSLQEISVAQRFADDDLYEVRSCLHARATRGAKVFTGAYVIPGVAGKNKVDSVCDLIETVARMKREDTMKTMWLALTRYDGLGSFLAGQIVADMAHLEAGRSWPDRDTWAPVGPGSARGINRLLGRPKDKAVAQAEFERLLLQLAVVVQPRVAEIWADRRLQAMDLQNCLCEFDKYRRLTLGEGKVRARYDGAAPADQGSLI